MNLFRNNLSLGSPASVEDSKVVGTRCPTTRKSLSGKGHGLHFQPTSLMSLGIVLVRLHFKIFSSGVPGPEIPRQSDQHKSTKLFREAEASLVTRQDMTLVLELRNSLVNRGANPTLRRGNEGTRGD